MFNRKCGPAALALAALLSLGAWRQLPLARAAALPVPAGVSVAPDDRSAIVQWDTNPQDPTAPLPAGVVGYKISWGPAATPTAFSKLTEERIIQLQPLVNGQPYAVQIQSVDSQGNLSAPSPSLSFTGDSTRVDGLRARMNGFFDDFNLPQGLPDETKWNSAYSRCNAAAANGFFINDQFHAHNTGFSANCDRGQSISRPRAVLDLSDGGTRTIVFDFDGAFRRNQWYLDLVPRLMDISGQVNIEGLSAPADPADGLRFHQSEQVASISLFGDNGAAQSLAYTDNVVAPKLDALGVKQVPNVRRHWEIHVSRSYAEVLIDGQKVLATKPGAFQLKQTRYYLLWNMFSYNSNKANVPMVLGHWDNFGFDAPAGSASSSVTHNYRLVNSGTDFMKAYGEYAPAAATLNIPDVVAGAAARRLMFTLQMDEFDAYSWSPEDRVTVNGSQFAIPKPVSNAQPALAPEDLVSTIAPYSVAIDLPDGVLKQGANQISFSTAGSSVHNIHAELDFDSASAPGYTPPAQAASGAPQPAIQPVGPNAVIAQIGATLIDPAISDLSRTAVFNQPVSGVVPIKAEVHNDIALQSTGSNQGVRQVDLLVDGVAVFSQRADAAAPAPAVLATFNLDTRKLANGLHEVYVRAYDARCVPSIADYLGAGDGSGSYYPLHISVRNAASAPAASGIAAAYRVSLPLITLGPRLQSSCASTSSAPPRGAPSGGAWPADLRRDEQLFVCEW